MIVMTSLSASLALRCRWAVPEASCLVLKVGAKDWQWRDELLQAFRAERDRREQRIEAPAELQPA